MAAIDNINSDLGFNIPSTYYENKSAFCKPEIKYVQVWIETKRDFNFWNAILENKIQNIKFNIQSTENIVVDGKVATGCSRILSLVDKGNIILGKNSIVCIDSDYYCITNLMNCSFNNSIPFHTAIDIANDYSKKFIFRTFIHSKESFFFKHDFLNDTLNFCTSSNQVNLKFCLYDALNEISKIIIKYFITILNLYKTNKINIDQRGTLLKAMINEISKINQLPFENFLDLSKFKSSPEFINITNNINNSYTNLIKDYNENASNIAALEKNLQSFSINEKNLFFFLKGHEISNLISGISNSYIKYIKTEATNNLKATLLGSNCNEAQIEAQVRDLSGCYRTSIIPSIFDRNYQNIHKSEYIKIVFDCINDCISPP